MFKFKFPVRAVPWLMRLAVGFSSRSHGFSATPVHVELVEAKVKVGQAFLQAFHLSLSVIIPPLFNIQTSTI
jgi:hypothetical protein